MKFFKQNILVKVLSINSISVGISFVLGVFSLKIVSIFLGAPGMALMGSFRNFTSMLKSIATLGINNSIIKLVVENKDDKTELSSIYSTFFWLFLGISLLLGISTICFAKTISTFLFYSTDFSIPIQFFGLILPLIVINTFWLAIYNALGKFKKIILIQIISNILIFIVAGLLIWKKNISGGLFSVVIGEILMIAVAFIFVIKENEYFKFDLQKSINLKYLKSIKSFTLMALLSAILAPLTLVFIRNNIVQYNSIEEAGIWDAINRFSGFYMVFFNSGLSLYYMPKLASLKTDFEFKTELKSYFKIIVPIFLLMLVIIFLSKQVIINLAFTAAFSNINQLLIWQLLGDFFKIMTLAFGYQIAVKTMMKEYFIGEIFFNVSYFLLSVYLMKTNAIEGVLEAYFYTNVVLFFLILFFFRKILLKSDLNVS